LQIGLGVEQPVHMVDTQTIQNALSQETKDEPMHMVEDFRPLHSDGCAFVDVEEAAVVDVVGGDAKIGRAPMLFLHQLIELAPALQAPRFAVYGGDIGFDSLGYIAVFLCNPGQLSL